MWWNARPRRSATCSTAASRPSRTIATRSQQRWTSSRSWDERKTVPPSIAVLAHHGEELLLHERVQAARGLVEHEQLGVVEERLDQADLLPVAARELARRAVEVRVEALGQLGGRPEPRDAAHGGTEAHELAAGHARVARELAGRACAAATRRTSGRRGRRYTPKTYPRIRARAALLSGRQAGR